MLRHYVATIHRRYHHDLAGFDQPWRPLGGRLDNLHVSQFGIGTGYLAHGHTPSPAPIRASHELSAHSHLRPPEPPASGDRQPESARCRSPPTTRSEARSFGPTGPVTQ